jgi:hypothetical protein
MGMLLSDERMLAIGAISLALGILIGRFCILSMQVSPLQILWKEFLLDYP